jgi:hypothetical protein
MECSHRETRSASGDSLVGSIGTTDRISGVQTYTRSTAPDCSPDHTQRESIRQTEHPTGCRFTLISAQYGN